MGERRINPKFNVNKIYKTVNIINPYRFSGGGGITELYTEGDAADYVSESNTVGTTWVTVNGTIESSTEVTPNDGSYCFKIGVNGAGSNKRVEFPMTVTSGDTYTIKIWAKAGTGTNEFAFWTNFSISRTTVTGDWAEYEFNVTASSTGTALIRMYANWNGATGSEYFYIDNISIEKTN